MAGPVLGSTALLLYPLSPAAQSAAHLRDNDRFTDLIQSEMSRVIRLSLVTPPQEGGTGWMFGCDHSACDIFLPGNDVSRRHFYINFNPHSGLLLLSNNSNMGTTVGSFFLKNRGASIVLQQGARIKCGNTLFSVRYPDRGRYQATYEELQKRYLGALLTKTDAKVMSTHATPVISRGRIGNYLDLEHLGSGGFGDVCLLAHFQSGRLFAAKRFRSGRGHPDAIRQEMELLKHLRHPNIIGYVESVQVGEDVVMVMEHAPCGHLGEQPLMRTVNMLEAIRQAVSAIEYLHKNNVVHRDLKPNNIVVHSQIPISVKVIDFGVSKIGQRMDTPAGTVIYMAPEVVSRPGGYTKAVDIWSLGLTLLEILGGLPEREAVAFQNHQSQREFSTYLKAVQCSLEVVRDGKVAKLLRLMLNPDPNARGTASQCIRAIDETKASFMGNFMENPARGLPPPVRPIEAQGRDQGRTAGARPQHLAVPPSAFLPVPMDIDSPC